MFLSDSHLPAGLTQEHYLSEASHRIELERGFLPAWHMIGSKADFPNDGDFRSFQLLDRSVIVWRQGESFYCYLNVCTHRFCAITKKDEGNFAERLRCQYHGWEYDKTGATRKIPDAPSFRPLTQGALGLTTYAVETVGDLIFVNLSENPVPLRDFLGRTYDLCAERFSDPWTQIWTWQPVCPANWKLANEITLEGYHVVAAHEQSLGQIPLPREEDMTHYFADDAHSELHVDTRPDKHASVVNLINYARFMGRKPDHLYVHWHCFPHFGVIATDAFAIAQSVLPLSPTTHVNLYRLFLYRGSRRDAMSNELFAKQAEGTAAFWAQVFEEDRATVVEHQRGISSPVLPAGGLISRREERVVHFHRYVLGLHGTE